MQCNQKCECIPQQLIKSLNKKREVPELDLQNCNIEHLHDLCQIKCDVKALILSSNKIQILEQMPLCLIYLDISMNGIVDVIPLNNLQNLRSLRCSNNAIQKFEISLPQIELLDLSNNQIAKLPLQNQTIYSIAMFGNPIKNYQESAIVGLKNLIILDGYLIKQSSEQDYVIQLQEQQLAQKHQMNVDYLSKWRQEVYKLIVRQKQYKLLSSQLFNQVRVHYIQSLNELKFVPIIEQNIKRLKEQQRKLQKCSHILRKQKQTLHYEQSMIMNSLKNLLEEQIPNDNNEKPDKLIRQCAQYIQNLKLSNQSLKFEKDVIQQENELLAAQVEHFQSMYNSIKSLKKDDSSSDKGRGFQQLYAQIRTLEEEKIKLSSEVNTQKEMKNLEILQIRSSLEQQVALLQQELEFTKQKLHIQQEEGKVRVEQLSQQFEKRMKLQDEDSQQKLDRMRQDQQLFMESYNQKEQMKNSDILKLKDMQNDLEVQLKSNKQEYEFKLKEEKNKIIELQNAIKQNKLKMNEQEDCIKQMQVEFQQQTIDLSKLNELKLQDGVKIQNELQKIIHDQGTEIVELQNQKLSLSQQNNDQLKIIAMKDGVIRQLSLQGEKKLQKPKQLTELEQRAMQILQEDDDF